MDKAELIKMTLKKLLDHFRDSPESFEYHDSVRNPNRAGNPTIYWQPKVQLNDHSAAVNDPNNCHAVVATFNPMNNELTCYIFLKAPANLSMLSGAPADCVVSTARWFETWRGNYKKFCRLRDLILFREKRKENLSYLRKLSSIFPDAMDNHWIDR